MRDDFVAKLTQKDLEKEAFDMVKKNVEDETEKRLKKVENEKNVYEQSLKEMENEIRNVTDLLSKNGALFEVSFYFSHFSN